MGLGILVGGFMAEYVSYISAFWVAAAMQCLGVVMFFIFTRYRYLDLKALIDGVTTSSDRS
jgi:predicted MFS family arabinose efflux permease